jgi:hypothetical protein
MMQANGERLRRARGSSARLHPPTSTISRAAAI